MFIISVEYKKPVSDVDACLPAHIEYLESQYSAGKFLLSGRKNPRTGGVILSNIKTKKELDHIIQQDPFYQHEIADYHVIEFEPTMACAGLEFLKK